jgi:hypothetical protein
MNHAVSAIRGALRHGGGGRCGNSRYIAPGWWRGLREFAVHCATVVEGFAGVRGALRHGGGGRCGTSRSTVPGWWRALRDFAVWIGSLVRLESEMLHLEKL